MTINLADTEPRDYLCEIERQLTQHGRALLADQIHAARPRDLAELFVLLPDDVGIQLWEVPHANAD